jgi:triphosphoribosyl-dephospho-CoA synthase
MTPEEIAAAFRTACLAELQALKPGNVHVHAGGHGMTVADFETSADVAAPWIARAGAGVGARILGAVEATRAAVGRNTNLGIVLLCAPLACAAERVDPGAELRARLTRLLDELDIDAAALAYRAIRIAAPGGLGASPQHDVRDEPRVDLREAMRAAAGRDRIAAQYANGFEDVFGIGVARLDARRAQGWPEAWAVTACYLAFLATFPDSHVLRNQGAALGEVVRKRAAGFVRTLDSNGPEASRDALLAWDGELKRQGINPGTSADLTVASLFASALEPRPPGC